jgi:hypothetical protein
MFEVIRLKTHGGIPFKKAIKYRPLSPMFGIHIPRPDHIGSLGSFIAYPFKPAARTTFCKAVLGH